MLQGPQQHTADHIYHICTIEVTNFSIDSRPCYMFKIYLSPREWLNSLKISYPTHLGVIESLIYCQLLGVGALTTVLDTVLCDKIAVQYHTKRLLFDFFQTGSICSH